MIVDTIVTDLDDTLLNENGEISPYALAVMRECLNRGVRVIPSSGRAQISMEPYIRRLQTGFPYIACNGAQIVNADHTILEMIALPAGFAREICAFFLERGAYAQVYRDEYIYYARECEFSAGYRRSSGQKGEAVGDLLGFLTFDTPRVLCIAEPAMVASLYPEARSLFAGRAACSVSKPYFLEVTPLEATKGAALKRLADRIDIKPKRTFVFGDSLNDLSMFEFTDNSVAMGNARSEVKAAARHICGPNSEDGMARFVKDKLLADFGEGGEH